MPGMGSPAPRNRLQAAGFDSVATTLVALGALFLLASFTILNWFREGSGFFGGAGRRSKFHDLHNFLEQAARDVARNGIASHVSFGASRPYFSWLGWVLLVAALAFGALAASPVGTAHFTARWFGAVVAAAGIALTFLAINLITFEGNAANNADAPSYSSFLAHTGPGMWAAVLGFLLVLVGCLVPRQS